MKIGIVNDSAMATEILRRIVSSAPEHEVLWLAANGAEAVVQCQNRLPELILMDLMMPVMDGVEATRRIMQATPCAILVVTATVSGHSSEVFEAMGAGALDAVATPALGPSGKGQAGAELLRKIGIISRLIGNDGAKKNGSPTTPEEKPKKRGQKTCLLAIGSSTGGPHALAEVLAKLPADFPAAIVAIQHMDQKFTSGLADWLNRQINLPVRLALEGERPRKGVVMLPSTNHHLVLTPSSTFHYTEEPADNFYHPSVDVFFNSVNRHWFGSGIGVLLTGMGRDGAQGLLELRQNGWPTIAQDQATCMVYGMPKAAAQLNAADHILPLEQIGAMLLKIMNIQPEPELGYVRNTPA